MRHWQPSLATTSQVWLAASRAAFGASATFSTGTGVSSSISPGRLVFPQAFERGLANIAIAGPAGELDFGDQFGFTQ